MDAAQHPRVKVCCIGSLAEAQMAVGYGAAALGLVSAMPSGPGVIGDEIIAQIAKTVPPGVASVLLTSRRESAAIISQQRHTGVSTLQLCDRLEPGEYPKLREALPGIALMQVIHMTGPDPLSEAKAAAPFVDGLLLDSGNPSLPVKELGGTGRVHDWSLSRRIRAALELPVFLAGGLTSDNVSEAIATVGPYAVDVCSGVRTEGHLDERKLARFFANVDRRFGAPSQGSGTEG
jgi:phosphoribosylanthranilate isomerase